MNKRSNGFTVIELIFIALVFGAASIIFFIQKNNIETVAHDDTRKTAINAMYYGLEEVFYTTNSYYPTTIDSTILKSVDPALFTDPDGYKIGDADSAYTYSPTNCTDNKCKSYTLKTILQNEDDYVKNSKNK